jgi:NAD(P)-dependent dehydrogenase (short-subunit alcohol dehydrogenase family)
MGAFDERVAIVVGGGRGIGRASALALAREGARVVIQDPGAEPDGSGADAQVAARVAAEIQARGGEALALATSATDPGAAKQLVEAARERFGRVDVGLYAAGVLRERPLVRMSDEDFDLALEVHVRGAFRFARELANALVEQRRGGAVLLCSSPAGFAGTPGQTGLAASAQAVVGLARAAASELRRQDIRINALVPTARTRLTEELPLFRSIRPDSLSAEHVAEVVCLLLSDVAKEISGEVIGVAGGRTYAFRASETPGVFLEGGPSALAGLADRLREVLGN